MKMIFVTGKSGNTVGVASDNISHVDDHNSEGGNRIVGECLLFLRQAAHPQVSALMLKGSAKQVSAEINNQLEEFKQ